MSNDKRLQQLRLEIEKRLAECKLEQSPVRFPTALIWEAIALERKFRGN
jgi:hypothetical protein